MHEEQLQKLAGEATSELNEAEKQFQLGLAKFGLLEVIVLGAILLRRTVLFEIYTNISALNKISLCDPLVLIIKHLLFSTLFLISFGQ